MYFHCRSHPRRFLAATLLFGLTHTSATTAAKITIDTDLLRIDGESNGTLFGTPFTAQLDSRGVAQFLFHGDLDLERDKILFIGNRPASFIVGGNANIEGATFDVSAVNQLGGIGWWRCRGNDQTRRINDLDDGYQHRCQRRRRRRGTHWRYGTIPIRQQFWHFT